MTVEIDKLFQSWHRRFIILNWLQNICYRKKKKKKQNKTTNNNILHTCNCILEGSKRLSKYGCIFFQKQCALMINVVLFGNYDLVTKSHVPMTVCVLETRKDKTSELAEHYLAKGCTWANTDLRPCNTFQASLKRCEAFKDFDFARWLRPLL